MKQRQRRGYDDLIWPNVAAGPKQRQLIEENQVKPGLSLGSMFCVLDADSSDPLWLPLISSLKELKHMHT